MRTLAPMYAIVVSAGRRMPKVRVRYSDALILLVLLWSGLHDRPLSWGCDPRNWKSTRVKPARLPSDSTVSRRLRSPRIMALMQFIEADLRGSAPPKLWKILDGKCLLIGRCSKDPDARAGPAGRGLGFGYKLHVIYGERLMPEVWDVRRLTSTRKRLLVISSPNCKVEGISLPIPNTIRANCTMIVVVAITNSLPRAAVDAPQPRPTAITT